MPNTKKQVDQGNKKHASRGLIAKTNVASGMWQVGKILSVFPHEDGWGRELLKSEQNMGLT